MEQTSTWLLDADQPVDAVAGLPHNAQPKDDGLEPERRPTVPDGEAARTQSSDTIALGLPRLELRSDVQSVFAGQCTAPVVERAKQKRAVEWTEINGRAVGVANPP